MAPVHACDRLAAAPLDRNRATEGVDQPDMNSAAAIVACQAAVEAEPGNLRFQTQPGCACVPRRKCGRWIYEDPTMK